jgi:ribosome-associated translation inhibitor RaiA
MINTREDFPIHVRTRWLDYSPALHWHTRTRFEAALRSSASRIRWVNVRISGSDGDLAKRVCDVEVVMKTDGIVAASAADSDAYRAADAAARRVRTVVRRHVDRAREELRRAA